MADPLDLHALHRPVLIVLLQHWLSCASLSLSLSFSNYPSLHPYRWYACVILRYVFVHRLCLQRRQNKMKKKNVRKRKMADRVYSRPPRHLHMLCD
ncbi:hypothetical protein AALO_G00209550 [Alosa alosa]|uniref:Secreted protein n=1 Tax=Alosa alosa TaxID=278164 RepID=A0AAV6FZF6_9TELE|nr:hypothetical protein AALO_G00209550 [Alosa alosa]